MSLWINVRRRTAAPVVSAAVICAAFGGESEERQQAATPAAAVPSAASDLSARTHWAFRPLKAVALPLTAAAATSAGNAIDHFIIAKLEAAGLHLSPPATRRVLVRRVTLDLVGLPPTPAEVDAFENDSSPHAYEHLLDRLLASPHYGERWGRHWLDLARFAESDGFEHDAVRPHSWRYRDYVVRAFNADKPYDRFVREQVAGDELWPGDPEAVIATGFNLLGPDMVDSSDQQQRRHNTLNDMTDTASLVFLGLTVGCARCHDHKFEPLSQRDYYQLQAFFGPAVFDRDRPIPTPIERQAFEQASKVFREHPKVRELAKMEDPVRERLRVGKLEKLSPEAQEAHRTPPDQRDAAQANLVLETEDKVKVTDKELSSAFAGEAKRAREELLKEVRALPQPPPLPRAMALQHTTRRAGTFVLHRGEITQPREQVHPGVPRVLRDGHETPRPVDGRRATLAEWMVSPGNLLTSRVMVNRLWQHHFGRGLVTTPSDFGVQGQRPSHPELLDWLAREFIARGWSVKAMHKLMLLSATYRQTAVATDDSSPATSDAAASARSVDPLNTLYWRMNRLRLEGEVIRDSLLAISGRLDPRVGGPGIIPSGSTEGASGSQAAPVIASITTRRSLYLFARRNLRLPFLEVFDAPDTNLSCPVRERSTTAPQALTLLNAGEVATAAKLTAELIRNGTASLDDQIVRGMRLALGRAPSARELDLAREFLTHSPLEEFCRALFNLNDFVYLE